LIKLGREIFYIQITVDNTPPIAGVVYEGKPGDDDIDYQSDFKIDVSWSGFFDKESGIKLYRYSVGNKCKLLEEFINESDQVYSQKYIKGTVVCSIKYRILT
jgi:hypothetical protein